MGFGRFLSRMLATSLVAAFLLALGVSCAAAATAPVIEAESASGVGPTDATLEAQIDPGGAPAGVYYQFQLAANPSELNPEIACPPEPSSGPARPCIGTHVTEALPIGFLPSGKVGSASLDLASAGVSLQPGRTYYYRVLVAPAIQSEDTVEWEGPAVQGPEQTFSTPPVLTPPEGAAAAPVAPERASSSSVHRRRHHRRHHVRHRRWTHAAAKNRA